MLIKEVKWGVMLRRKLVLSLSKGSMWAKASPRVALRQAQDDPPLFNKICHKVRRNSSLLHSE
jgi:hypothetical protein